MIIDGSSSSSSPPSLSSSSSVSSPSPALRMINACLLVGVVSLLLVQSNQYVSTSISSSQNYHHQQQKQQQQSSQLQLQLQFQPQTHQREAARQLLPIRPSMLPFGATAAATHTAAGATSTSTSTSTSTANFNGSSQQAISYFTELSAVRSELEVAQLIVFKFHDLFEQQQQQQNKQDHTNQSSSGTALDDGGLFQAALETRKIDAPGGAGSGGGQDSPHAQISGGSAELNDRNYFKILNRVFSRVELPELYKSSRNPPSRGLHCGPHIGCIEEIPNFPSLLKRPNISSSFTIYSPFNPSARQQQQQQPGKKILFEPIIHHQLQDNDQQQQQQQDQPQTAGRQFNNKRFIEPISSARAHQTAASWRSASKIVSSQEYPFDLAALEQSGFDSTLNTRIIVGGYFAKEDEEWIDEIVKQWSLLEPQSNIIKVSWADANRGLYHTAAYNSRIVGRQLTLFLHYLDQLFHIDLDRFHLVGHSLGAHIAGFAGSDNEGRIARITGLDPAGPIFVELNTSMRLDPGDAQFVDVMHTNGGTITKGALGLSIPSGHVDYYCNGGSIQPGCYFSSVTKSMMDPVERVACSHRRSYRYFTELIKLAINENALNAYSPPAPESVIADQELSQITWNLTTTTTTTVSPSEMLAIQDNLLARRLHHDEDQIITASAAPSNSRFPRAFLFEARQEDLVKLSQPEIVIMSRGLGRREMNLDSMAPLKRQLEFHQIKPNFPAGKRGMYFFKTRSESPFFASKQYALTLRTDQIVRRKMTLMARIDHTLVAEVEADEIPGLYTIAFVPNDPKLFNLNGEKSPTKIPQVSLMWRFRSFNLLLNQQNELPLIGLELSLLDSESDQAPLLIKYSAPGGGGGGGGGIGAASLPTAVFRGISGASQANSYNASPPHMSLTRNQWHRFEGKLVARPAMAPAAW